ncbi:hypothetical protein AB0H77_04740 [Streptomyces sp. NPDC050844]|uniref:hypothetical protein n=1 Tax=Streptomyces sp. NPDC050844 TaxID=3155790 RepID=UPI0034052A3B
MDDRTVNAVELRQPDTLSWIEFGTVICDPTWAELGFGAFGNPVKFAGVLMAVANGRTAGRAWSRVRVRVSAPATGVRADIVSTLGGHRTVTLTSLED